MKRLFYFLLLVLLPWALNAQDASQANALIEQAKKAIESNNRANAQTTLTKALDIFASNNLWEGYLDGGLLLIENSIELANYDLAIQVANECLKKAEAASIQSITLALINKNLGKAYYLLDDYKNALPYFEQEIKIREKIDPQDPDLARAYGNTGILSRFGGRSSKAIEYLNKAISIQKDNNVLARLYSELGTNYKLLGNFRKSLDNQNQAIRLLEDDTDVKALASALSEKGSVLTNLKQEGEDMVYLKQSLALFESPEAFDYTNQMNCLRQIATSFFRFSQTNGRKGDLDSAQVYYEKALAIALNHLPTNNPYIYQTLFDISAVLVKKNDFDKAAQFITQGDSKSTSVSPQSPENFAILGSKADFYFFQGKYVDALGFIQKQLISQIPNFEETAIDKLPTKEQIVQTKSYDAITQALAVKARCWYQYYKYGGNDKKHLEEALKTIRLFDETVNQMRSEFASSGSNVAWSDLTLDTYENAIEICLAMAKVMGDPSYKKQALFYSEKSKGLTLLEAFQNTKASEVAGLSQEQLIQERELKLDINDLEQQVFVLTQRRKPELQEEIKSLQKQIFIKKEAYQEFLKKLETNNPEYYNAKYNLTILDLEQIRSMLKNDQGLIEYFVGDSAVYAFKITKTEFEVFALSGEENMESRVGDFRTSIYGFFLTGKDKSDQMKSKYAQQYTERAYKLYQKLVEPLGALPKRLIIVPAGPMCDMPFEPLLTQAVSDNEKYKSHPYFLKEHIISYSYSATLLQEMMNKTHEPTQGTYVGFAPSFGESAASVVRGKRFSLSPLAFNKPEIEGISALLGTGTVYKDAEAVENQFKKIASDYQIIHFATHGMANSNDPDFSLLAFTDIPDGQENEFLYVSDLYNLELNADMVVLSACETALGKNFRGEGIMSLARGFSYAGAKSIFTTLWSVNDNSTYTIINGYFKYLQQGMEKDEALHQSKLDYIESANNFTAHPFLWSPYILVGDTDTIPSIQKGLNWMPIAGGAVGVVLLGLLAMRFLRRKEVV